MIANVYPEKERCLDRKYADPYFEPDEDFIAAIEDFYAPGWDE
jgi:hypothetical protein